MDFNQDQITEQLRRFGAREEQIPQLLADIKHRLQEYGAAQIFGMPDGTLRAVAPSELPGAATTLGSVQDVPDHEDDAADTMSRDIALYVDVLSVLENSPSERMQEQFARMATVLEDKLDSDVEDYIAATQISRHKAEGDREKQKLTAWKAQVAEGQTQLSYKDWEGNLPG